MQAACTHKGAPKKKKEKKLNPQALLYTVLAAIHIGSSACRENYEKTLCVQSKVCVVFYFLCPCYFILLSTDMAGDLT